MFCSLVNRGVYTHRALFSGWGKAGDLLIQHKYPWSVASKSFRKPEIWIELKTSEPVSSQPGKILRVPEAGISGPGVSLWFACSSLRSERWCKGANLVFWKEFCSAPASETAHPRANAALKGINQNSLQKTHLKDNSGVKPWTRARVRALGWIAGVFSRKWAVDAHPRVVWGNFHCSLCNREEQQQQQCSPNIENIQPKESIWKWSIKFRVSISGARSSQVGKVNVRDLKTSDSEVSCERDQHSVLTPPKSHWFASVLSESELYPQPKAQCRLFQRSSEGWEGDE